VEANAAQPGRPARGTTLDAARYGMSDNELKSPLAASRFAIAGMRPRPLLRAGRLGPRVSFGSTIARTQQCYVRIFTARAATSRTVSAESVDSAAISALAGRVSGIASVGLNAVAFVSAT